MALCGSVWLYVALGGSVWLCVALCGFVRLFVASCGLFKIGATKLFSSKVHNMTSAICHIS